MCQSRQYHRHVERPTTAPAPAPAPAPHRDPALRASDAEREAAVGALREHGAAGRLDVEELEQRVGAAYAARTHGELGQLLSDLPTAARRRTPARPASQRDDNGWPAFFAVSVLLVAIWAFSGAGYFWPAWVIAWWGFALVMKSPASRGALVTASLARLLRPR